MLKGIVFDLDGTIVDSLSATFDAFNHAIVSLGGRKHSSKEILAYFGPGEGQIFARILGPEKADEAYAISRQYIDDNMERIPLHDGMDQVLDHFRALGVPISIFTGRSWRTTEMILKHHGLLDRFVTVIANDHVAVPKPSPEGLHLASKRMNIPTEELLFVGDSGVDMHAARLARSKGVAALWDLLARRESLEHHQPHHWAKRPTDLIDIWAKETG